MRKCVNCGNPANTIQHLLPKSVTDPEHYIRLAECEQCHNYGLDCSNAVSQRLMNNINTIPTTQVVTVNNLPVVARAGSLAPGKERLFLQMLLLLIF